MQGAAMTLNILRFVAYHLSRRSTNDTEDLYSCNGLSSSLVSMVR